MKFWVGLSTFLLSASCFAASQTCADALSLFAENDMFFSDRYYTNGLKIQWTHGGGNLWTNAAQFAVLDLFVKDSPKAKRFQTLSLGQNMYVPRSIKIPVPSLSDRPYAGWLYLNAASHVATENSLDTFAITAGIFGRHSYAGDVQQWWHDTFDFDEPLGWDYQLDDEFGFVLSYKHSQRVWRAKTGALECDAIVSGAVDAGNVMCQGVLSALLRVGSNLPESFDFCRIDYASSTDVAYSRGGSDFHFYFQCGASARFVGYDITINGGAFASSPYKLNPEWFVCEPMGGFSLRYKNAQADFNLTYRTRDFRGQDIGHHTFWTVSLKYLF